jgi:hypothetical protein
MVLLLARAIHKYAKCKIEKTKNISNDLELRDYLWRSTWQMISGLDELNKFTCRVVQKE